METLVGPGCERARRKKKKGIKVGAYSDYDRS